MITNKKMLKAMLGLTATFWLLISMLQIPMAFAASDLKVSLPKSIQADKGQTIDIPVTLTGVPVDGIACGTLGITFDNTKMSYLGITPGSIINSSNDISANAIGNNLVVIYSDDTQSGNSHIQADGVLATVSFSINTDCPDGEYTLKIGKDGDNPAFFTTNFEEVNVEFSDAAVSVPKYIPLPAKGCLDFPKNNQIISGTYRMQGWFLDGEGLSSIEILVDDQVVGKAVYGDLRTDVSKVYPQYKNDNSGFHFDFDTSLVSEGKHTLKVREIGNTGVVTTLSAKTIIVSRYPVIGYIDSPKNASSVYGIVNIAGWIGDTSGVSKIDVIIDNVVVGQAVYGDYRPDVSQVFPYYKSNTGFHYVLNTLELSEGSHTLVIRETGLNGGQTQLAPKTFTVSKNVVKGYIDNPKSVVPVSGTVNVYGWVGDISGVSKIDVILDGTVVGQAIYGDFRPDVKMVYPYYGSNTGFHYFLDTSKLGEGSHTLVIKTTGVNGVETQLAPKTFVVSNSK